MPTLKTLGKLIPVTQPIAERIRDCSDIAEDNYPIDSSLTDDTKKGYSSSTPKRKKKGGGSSSKKSSKTPMAPAHTTNEMEVAMSKMGGEQMPMRPMGSMGRMGRGSR